jgi:SAM-dependent methyltransferase
VLKSGQFLKNYLKVAPVPLAVERSYECEILSKQTFKRPILDIGCGDGLFTQQLFDEKIDVGIDPHVTDIKHAIEMNVYNETIQCWGNNIPKPDQSFKTIFSNSVLEHIKDLKPVLVEAHRLLDSDGSFYVTVPTDNFDRYSVLNQILEICGLMNLSIKYRNFFNRFWQHYHYYNIEGWTDLFKQTGFTVKHHQIYCSKLSGVMCDALAPLSGPSWIVKKMTNRWFLSLKIRQVTAVFLNFLSELWSDKNVNLESGGIVFFHLIKTEKK